MSIFIQNLCKSYGKKQILDHLHLAIEGPGIWALIGPNGAGKTTLMDCMANLQTIDQGDIRLAGKKHTDPSISRVFSYLQDNRVLYPELSGREHLQFIQRIQRLDKSRIEQVIEEIGIGPYVDRAVKTYSLGMKQHLLLAIGIMNQPQIMLLDEPLNGLDPSSYIETRQLLQRLAQKGATIIVSSHQLSEVDQLTDQLLFLRNGKLIERKLDSLAKIYVIDTTDNDYVAQHLGPLNGIEVKDGTLRVDTSRQSLHHILEKILACKVQILDISLQANQSEAIYKELFD